MRGRSIGRLIDTAERLLFAEVACNGIAPRQGTCRIENAFILAEKFIAEAERRERAECEPAAETPVKSLLARIVTPGFITWQAHMWFAYAVAFTWCNRGTVAGVVLYALVKEFYVDKHFENAQSFDDNLQDFAGYFSGVVLAVAARYLGL